ncbi:MULTISPECIES: hypothetical protein [unclassified Curtobacterium]|uniref:hypothetical protein n=1 Tax=unclassified Curtobacterium TaxID=257496 RepID=UPI00052ABFD7|nr:MULTISPECIES: hypothetical protein [unclassified Curtobacterium]AIV40016.1 hypothetical protein NI26_07040 [Curtobacterium sp. MR_MD2014]MBP1300545.1 hypothetical protein [Curtobacterium sp. 1310]MCM3505114.1 hypothetical protein [Curtobacterium sp. ODYSSEY 48 V2]MCM3521261.1 hypothetical protein [Curtobacterium sp. P97]MDB6425986.1 hypothetical protein [Curtobacterium sp. 20TX0008]
MTIIATDLDTGPTTARAAGIGRTTPRFAEVVEARRQRGLQIAAVSTGLLSVTVAASAAILLGLSA